MLTSVTPIVRQGAVAPEALAIKVSQGDSTVDLSTATAVSIHVRKPDGETATWTAAIVSRTTVLLVASHSFAIGDTVQLGEHALYVSITVPGGVVRSEPQAFKVVPPFGGC